MGSNDRHAAVPATRGTVSAAIVRALEAADVGDAVEVRVPVVRAANQHGWDPVVRRLDIAGRALAFDVGAEHLDDAAMTQLATDIGAIGWAEPFERTAALAHLVRWAAEGPARSSVHVDESEVWHLLVGVDYLRRRLEYPPQVAA